MGLKKNKYEQISVGHFCGKNAMANRYGTPKNKNEQISVRSFMWEARYGSKKKEMFFVFF